jgi:hypothetical protein
MGKKSIIVAAALTASLSSAGCATSLAVVSSVLATDEDDRGSATAKRLGVGVVVDALLVGALYAVMPTWEFGGGDH